MRFKKRDEKCKAGWFLGHSGNSLWRGRQSLCTTGPSKIDKRKLDTSRITLVKLRNRRDCIVLAFLRYLSPKREEINRC